MNNRFGGYSVRSDGYKRRAFWAVTILSVVVAVTMIVLSVATGGRGVVYPDLAYHSEGWHIEKQRAAFVIDGGEEAFGSVKLDVDLFVYKDRWFCIEMKRLCGPEYKWWFDIHFEGHQATTADFGPACYCYQVQGRDLYVKWVHVAGNGTGRAVYRPVFSVREEPIPGCEPRPYGW